MITTCHVRVQDLIAAERPNSARSVVEKVTRYPLQWQEKRLLDSSIGIIALNRRIETSLRCLSERVLVRRIPNAIDTDDYLVPTREKESNRVIYFGQLIERKNLETLLRAFAHFLSEKRDARLVIIGRGNLEAKLKALSKDLGATESVEFLGYVPEDRLKKELARASIFVLPSFEEGMSSALLEAMASGLVCLASNIEANKDVITDSENGLLFPPDNYMALAELLGSCSDNEELRTNLSRSAREYVVKKHDWNVIVKDIEEFYHAAIDHTVSASASPVSPMRRE
jgi:glycosyltransferase involved in cell wall biosynthesis